MPSNVSGYLNILSTLLGPQTIHDASWNNNGEAAEENSNLY